MAIRIDVKVTPNDSQVFLDDQLRAAEQRKLTWGLYPRGEEWRWVRDEVRVDVEHVTWWDAPVRPVMNRPWAPAAAQGRAYKVAQHACSNHVQGQASTSQGKSHSRVLGPASETPSSVHSMKQDPGSYVVVCLQHDKGHQGPTLQPRPSHQARPKELLSNPTQGRGQHVENFAVGDTRVRPFSPRLPLARHDSMHGKQVPELECPRPGPGPLTHLRASESGKHLILAPLPGRTRHKNPKQALALTPLTGRTL